MPSNSTNIYEIDDCTAFGPCSTRGITPARLLVCGEQISRQRGETAREPQLPDHSKDPGNYKLNTASAPTTACFVTGQHYPMYPARPPTKSESKLKLDRLQLGEECKDYTRNARTKGPMGHRNASIQEKQSA